MRIIRIPPKKFSEPQKAFINCKARFKLWRASRRQGKTEAMEYDDAMRGIERPGINSWFVAQDLALCNERNIPLYREILGDDVISSYSKSERKFQLINNTTQFFKTVNSSDSLRGRKVHHLSGEEIAYWPSGGNVFHNILRPQLADTMGSCSAVFSPPTKKAPIGAEWVRRLEMSWREEVKAGNPDYAIFHNTIWDSPYITLAEKKSLERMTDPDTWQCEYMAEYNDKQGTVYWEFDPLVYKHTIEESEPVLMRVRGLDWGIADNTACVWISLLRDNRIYVEREYVANNLDVPSHARAIKAATQQPPHYTILDSACWARDAGMSSVAKRFAAEGIASIPGTKDLDGSTSDVKLMFSNGSIIINPACTNILQAIENWQHGQHEPDPLAAMRYAIDALIRNGKLMPPMHKQKIDTRNALEKFEAMAKAQERINSKMNRVNGGNAFRFI